MDGKGILVLIVIIAIPLIIIGSIFNGFIETLDWLLAQLN